MKKLLPFIVGSVVIFAGGAAYLLVKENRSSSTNTTKASTDSAKTGENALVAVDACDVLSESAAKQIIEGNAKKADTSLGSASSDALSVSSCIYTAEIAAGTLGANNTRGASVLVRAAKTKAGAESNKSAFADSKPAGAEDVAGIGDKAFFNPQFGQLNVLKGSNWYIVSSYIGSPSKATLEDDKKLAELLNFK